MNPILEEVFNFAVNMHPTNEEEQTLASATQLVAPPQQIVLAQRYKPKKDPVKCLKLVAGTAFHALVERVLVNHPMEVGEKTGLIIDSERRMFAETPSGKVGGSVDLMYRAHDSNHWSVRDFKTTSAVTVARMSRIEEWTEQLNIYAWLARCNGMEVADLGIIAALLDWSTTNLRKDRSGTYPQTDIVEIDVPLWTQKKATTFVNRKAKTLADSLKKEDKDLPRCKDVWGGRRCESYCDSAPWCCQYKKKQELDKDFK